VTISEPFPFTFQGAPARLYVLRNDGFCWGRIVRDNAPDGEEGAQLDVSTHYDQYDKADEDAAECLMDAARNGHAEPIAGAPL
jgi:hypothetical protein